ncbi:MAG: hypothetical protein L6R42_001010 [Xanthoria sp. 1 TBL-2021]|nr:MAG: hypothetical protein L6R42_001010 [Xanthoria sp. 1 TBL-2021]
MASNANPCRYYLISYPRTASNLLLKILALDRQPNVSTGEFDGGYFFLPVDIAIARLGLQGRNVDDWTADEVREVRDKAQDCFETMRQCVESAESRGHKSFIKEHTVFLADPTVRSRLRFSSVRESPWTVEYGGGASHSSLNFTMLPDEFLLTFLPIFLIRHPAQAFPSLYRAIVKLDGKEAADRDDFAALMITLEWTRSLYEFYVQRQGSLACSPAESVHWPIIIDADDIMAHPNVVAQLCDRMGMDHQQLRFSWDQVRTEDISDVDLKVLRSTLYESTGIIGGKTSTDLDIDAEAAKWRAEFGNTAAERIAKLVREATSHYDYLRERRLRPASRAHDGADA